MDFDPQAHDFDARAGLAAADPAKIAEALLSMTNLRPEDARLEVGAGTGEVGQHLSPRVRYLGLDASREMLREFRARSAEAVLLLADASHTWPVASQSVRAVFMSRVAHLLDREVLMSELFRVAHSEGCFVIIGRRYRGTGSIQRVLQGQLHALLEARGLTPRRGERDSRALLEALVERGAQPLQTVEACRFEVTRAPADFLRNWSSKAGLSGLTLDARLKASVLAELESWARSQWSDLERSVVAEEHYALMAVRIG